MAHEVVRVNAPDDPQRCKGSTSMGQCWNRSIEGADFCPVCAGANRASLVEKNRHQYLLTNPRFRARMAELSEGEEIKSLRDEIAIARMLVEELLNRVRGSEDVSMVSGKVNALLLTIERLTGRAHIIEQNLGNLLQKLTVLKLMQTVCDVITEEVSPLPGGREAIDRIVDRVFTHASLARNLEPARGIKLIEQEP